MQLYPLAIAVADIRHRRYLPKPYAFQSQLTYLWFDPEQLEHFAQTSILWSTKKWNFLSLDSDDFLANYQGTIREKVLHVLEEHTLEEQIQIAEIRVLALPRTLGFRFNSVVFYFLFNAQQKLQFILSEITNTPWLERQVYVHDCRTGGEQHSEYTSFHFQFDKAFHVSPFMPMDLKYQWTFSLAEKQNYVLMQLFKEEKLQFDASMRFELTPITLPSQLHRYAVFKLFEPIKMVAGIYYHAFKLWINRVPFYRHPNKTKDKL